MNFLKINKLLALFFTSLLITGCYRMPTDDDFSLIPVTNNPSITCEKPSALPGMPTSGR